MCLSGYISLTKLANLAADDDGLIGSEDTGEPTSGGGAVRCQQHLGPGQRRHGDIHWTLLEVDQHGDDVVSMGPLIGEDTIGEIQELEGPP